MKLYDLVHKLLRNEPHLRDDDKELIWEVWKCGNNISREPASLFGSSEFIYKDAFLKAPNVETIRRTRQKIQEDHPELRATVYVQNLRKRKQSVGKYFVYHENIRV